MKDKILEIIENNTWIRPQDGEQNMDKAADEIAQMMCDEIFWCINCCVDLKKTISESAMIRVSQLGFTSEQIDNALNKIK